MGQPQRLELQAELEALIALHPDVTVESVGDHVSFQPDEESVILYPHIVYSRDPAFTTSADNIVYRSMQRYEVQLIDRKPDNPVYDLLVARKYCSHTTSFVADGLHHDVFDLYH